MALPAFIYFDIDDTLLDHVQAQNNALRYVYDTYDCFKEIGADFEIFTSVYSEVNRALWREYSLGNIDRNYLQFHRFRDTLEKCGFHLEHSEEIGEEYIKYYRNQWKWIDGAQKALMLLSHSYRLGFITNGFSETQKKKVEFFGLKKYSDHIIISEDVGHLKPSPEIFNYAEEIAGSRGKEVLYVGDNFMSDIQGGNAAGWQTAWYTKEKNEDMAKQASIVFSSYEQLTEQLL